MRKGKKSSSHAREIYQKILLVFILNEHRKKERERARKRKRKRERERGSEATRKVINWKRQ